MINNKNSYRKYLKADKRALNIKNNDFFSALINYISPNPIWIFQKKMRKLEYFTNCKNKGIYKPYILFLRYKYKKASIKLGFSIPINVFGPGLAIVHYGTIIVNSKAKVGANCRIHACTNIGASGGSKLAPKIGDNVYIAPGVKIFGNISIANNTAISANSVVNKSVYEENMMVAGIPARTIKPINIKSIIKHI
ncbi:MULTISPECIES: serine O-acetyltransferase [Mangrovimonas]|uniref:serine O-acetyltransferase n=1 Tax=Mangrovimonas TaxID=1211036 RepID=UPI0006B59977|nr:MULTISPECIES: serine acetyltransferase [Mangrovimonas]OMP30689.1 serine acetyltransferase [Mangrovimonas sp. DI 80]